MNTQSTRYSRTAIAFHWLMALGLPATLALGYYMSDLPFSPAKLQLYSWHKWAGITLLLLALLRLGWRLSHSAPAPVAGMPAWQRFAAEGTHHALYLLMLAIPLSGWLMSSAKGFTTVYFGLIPLPDLVQRNAELGNTLAWLHGSLNLALTALVALHAAAAIKHHLIDRDDTLARMLPFIKRA